MAGILPVKRTSSAAVAGLTGRGLRGAIPVAGNSFEVAGMPEPLFTVSNHHTPSCGEPPIVDGDAPHTYHGYFENGHGEQAMYRYDHETGEATVQLGDAGWGNAYRVVDGRAQGVILGEAEALWIRACWLATGAVRQRSGRVRGGDCGDGPHRR
jgi:hypothetical protein